MELKEIASIAGKGGLYRIVKPTRSGVIVESIDDKKQRLVVNASQRVSVLKEISIYTNTADGTEPLLNVLQSIHREFGDDPGVDSNSSSEELRAFLQHVLPDFDKERVYVSDIKKLVSWYKILLQNAPEIMQESAGTAGEGTEGTSTEEISNKAAATENSTPEAAATEGASAPAGKKSTTAKKQKEEK